MRKFFTLTCTLFFCCYLLSAQDGKITGTITDIETKDPLAGATVRVDKAKGALSDASGQFSVKVPAGEHDISVSFVGYKSDKKHITIQAGETLKLDFPLNSSALQMNQVVTVSQYGKNSAQETVTTEVISRAEIQNTNSNDIGQVVSKVPGVLVQDGQITIRGGSAYSYGVGTRTALLVDGLSLTSPDLQQTQNSFVALENVKQVEVVKGASSVIYGSNALDGVINVISEWPSDDEPKTEIESNLGVYSAPKLAYQKWWNTAPPAFGSINVNHQRRFKHVQFILGGNVTATNSYVEDNGEFRARLFFRLRYIHPKIAGLSMGVTGAFMLDRIDQFFISKNLDSAAFIPADYSTSAYELTSFDPFLTYRTLKGHQYKLQLRYMNIFRQGNGTEPNAVSHYIEVQNQYQYRLPKDLFVITAGMPFDVGIDRSNLYTGVHDNYNWAVYAQGEFNYKILTLQAGLRYELAGVDTYFIKSQPVFRSGINIHAAAATWFRASWGQGYRIPSVAEKYLADDFTSGIVIIPNDTLKAESSWSFELGFRQGFLIRKNWKLFIDAAFFWQQYKNYIEYIVNFYANQDSHGNPYLPDSLEALPGLLLGPKPFNVASARVAGYELTLSSDGKLGPVGIRMTAGYTYNYPRSLEKGPDNNGYTTGDYIKDLFKFNFERIPTNPPGDTGTLIPLTVRNLVHADIELSYWKMILGTTISYYSSDQVVSGLFQDVAFYVMHNQYALNDYLAQHTHGDATADIRVGYKHNDHLYIGFIVKNVANRFYELRPGLPEPTRNYTIQFRYSF